MNPTASLLLKITGIVLLVLVAYHFWPGLAALMFVCGVVLLVFLGIAAFSTTLLVVVGGALALAVVGSAIGVAVSLAPIWLPVLAIIGLIALIRGSSAPSSSR
jgi:hypothetical protein